MVAAHRRGAGVHRASHRGGTARAAGKRAADGRQPGRQPGRHAHAQRACQRCRALPHGLDRVVADRRFLAGAPHRGRRARACGLLPHPGALPRHPGDVRNARTRHRRNLRQRAGIAASAALRHLGGRRHGRQSQRGCQDHRRDAGRAAARGAGPLSKRTLAVGQPAQPIDHAGTGERRTHRAAGTLPRAAPRRRRAFAPAPWRHAVPPAQRPDARAPAGHPGRCRWRLCRSIGARTRSAADPGQPAGQQGPACRLVRGTAPVVARA